MLQYTRPGIHEPPDPVRLKFSLYTSGLVQAINTQNKEHIRVIVLMVINRHQMARKPLDLKDVSISMNVLYGGVTNFYHFPADLSDWLSLKVNECDANSECINRLGTYECRCNPGYNGDGRSCVDIDECISSPCGEHGICNNLDGSYQCDCKSGFESLSKPFYSLEVIPESKEGFGYRNFKSVGSA